MAEHCCPKCGSKAYKRNGFTRHGKQNHRCLECGRQFSLEPAIDDTVIHVPTVLTVEDHIAAESHVAYDPKG